MSVDYTLNILAPLNGLANRLANLAAITNFSDGGHTFSDWEFAIDTNDQQGLETATDFANFIHSRMIGGWFQRDDSRDDVLCEIRFKLDNQPEVQNFMFWCIDNVQDYYTSKDYVIFSLRTAQHSVTEDGAKDLFLANRRGALFEVLKTLDVLYGYESSYDSMGGWREYDESKDHLAIYDPLVIGSGLVSHFGIENLRRARPFARWELNNLIFVYTHPMYYHTFVGSGYVVLDEHGIAAPELQPKDGEVRPNKHELADHELWSEQKVFTDYDDLIKAWDLSRDRLTKALGLPKIIPFTEIE